MTNQPQGRLELTWANKDLRLLAHADETYEWVDPSDWRVSETRLLRETARIGEPSDNLLIRGDALHALRALGRVPELRERYQGKVRLCYIDPPFNTGQAFTHYDDALENSVWLTMLRDRLIQIREMLAANGSVWVHLDDGQEHRARSVLDEVFGSELFVGTIVWRSSDNSNNDALQFSTDHNYILVYGKSAGWTSNRLAPMADQVGHFANPDNDPNGPWFDGNPLNSPNPRPNLRYVIRSPQGIDINPPPNGWRWSRETLEAKMATGEIRFTPDGRGIRRRTYLRDHRGLPASSLWTDLDETGHNRQAKSELRRLFPGIPTAELFPTPKPERLIARILAVATDPGDLVLDCFAGSGTTAAVAHKMGRRWVVSELREETVAGYARPRLEKVVEGADPGGVTADAGWVGGGGFTVAEVGPSMFEDIGGVIVLAEWAVGGALAEAVAAQVGYTREADPPFVGRRGRSRLAVIDGVLSEDVARFLIGRLDERETVLIVAQAIEEGISDLVRTLRPGSRVRKVPRDLARTSRFVGPVVTLGTTEPTGQVRMPT